MLLLATGLPLPLCGEWERERGPERADGNLKVTQLVHHRLGWGHTVIANEEGMEDRWQCELRRELRWLQSLPCISSFPSCIGKLLEFPVPWCFEVAMLSASADMRGPIRLSLAQNISSRLKTTCLSASSFPKIPHPPLRSHMGSLPDF